MFPYEKAEESNKFALFKMHFLCIHFPSSSLSQPASAVSRVAYAVKKAQL